MITMARLSGAISLRSCIVVAIDLAAAALSLRVAFYLRLEPQLAAAKLGEFPWGVPLFAAIAGATFLLLGTHRRIWRFTSSNDIIFLGYASMLAIGFYYVLMIAIGHGNWMPRSMPFIQWLVLMVSLAGTRAARKVAADFLKGEVLPPAPMMPIANAARLTLLAGPTEQVELLLRQLERRSRHAFRPVGILDTHGALTSTRVRGVPVMGSTSDLMQVVDRLAACGQRPQCLLYADRVERLRGSSMVRLITDAQSLGLDVAYLPDPVGYDPSVNDTLDFRYLDLADLLGRPQATLAIDPVARAIAGRRVLVTGAGGTIGRELARQIASFNPAKLLLLDSNEFNLYEVDLELADNHPSVARVPILCSIRQRAQIMQAFRIHRPELVFHAAALKHVPLVEEHPSAGVQTNVLGTRNVADAARRFGAIAMVQVSTDKAVNPVGFMGVTKRLGELYCQALDLAEQDNPNAPRFMTVRFGNVLGSSGSLIPLFQRQLSRGGPLTVTHPDIERFFMTVHEAVQLVLHGAARGLQPGAKRGRIFVLDMGEPIRVMEIARRMIRLAGLEPDADVKIDIVGLRPGEKLFEELFDEQERRLPGSVAGIMEAESRPLPLALLNEIFDAMAKASAKGDDATCRQVARSLLDSAQHVSRPVIRFNVSQPAQTPQLAAKAG
jgi:O-antigen biosynthesis protein WbqV